MKIIAIKHFLKFTHLIFVTIFLLFANDMMAQAAEPAGANDATDASGSIKAEKGSNKEDEAEGYGPKYHPFQGIWQNSLDSFNLENTLYFHLPAIASTAMLVATDWDYDIQLASQKTETMPKPISEAFFAGGWFMPIVVTGGLYGYGYLASDNDALFYGAVTIQALGVSSLVNFSQKILTGRRGPDKDLQSSKPSGSSGFKRSKKANDFRFDFWNHLTDRSSGRFFWPSGHTSSTITIAAALTAASESWTVGIVGYSLSLGMGWAMVDGDHHWISDVVAGALIGHAIGWTIGRNFRLNHGAPKIGSIRFSPLMLAGMQGLQCNWYF